MFILELGSIKEEYPDLDSAMIDCFEVYPDADFSDWNELGTETWMTIYENNKTNSIIVGRITDVAP